MYNLIKNSRSLNYSPCKMKRLSKVKRLSKEALEYFRDRVEILLDPIKLFWLSIVLDGSPIEAAIDKAASHYTVAIDSFNKGSIVEGQESLDNAKGCITNAYQMNLAVIRSNTTTEHFQPGYTNGIKDSLYYHLIRLSQLQYTVEETLYNLVTGNTA
jgi:hypothetical protein